MHCLLLQDFYKNKLKEKREESVIAWVAQGDILIDYKE
jgi:hypothetical protein